MPRARNIKPGFFKNEILIELSFEARLLFIGLWTIADREGRLEDRPKRIKMETFPADNVDIDLLLSQLHNAGFIKRYEAAPEQHQSTQVQDNNKYIQILNFKKHQHPHKNESESIIPSLEQHQSSTRAIRPDTDSLILNPDYLRAEYSTPVQAPAHTDFENLEFKGELVAIAAAEGLSGEPGAKCWRKFKVHFAGNPPQDPLKAWKKWAMNERKPPTNGHNGDLQQTAANPLTIQEEAISRLGSIHWKRKQRGEFISQGDSKFIADYEAQKGVVWWVNLQQWRESEEKPPD